jgi:hypothetical protein
MSIGFSYTRFDDLQLFLGSPGLSLLSRNRSKKGLTGRVLF